MTAAVQGSASQPFVSSTPLFLALATFLRACATAADIHLIDSEPLRFSCDLRHLQVIGAF
jgi:hypothetical protein